MYSPHPEERIVTSLVALAYDIAHQLESTRGKTVVVCEQPAVLASLVSKKCRQRLRPLVRDYAIALDPPKRQELAQRITWLRSLVVSAVGRADQLETAKTDVLCCTTETLLRYAPVCTAMYITCPIRHADLHLITAWMQPGDRVVCYRIVPKQKVRVTRVSVSYRVRYGRGESGRHPRAIDPLST